MNRKVSRLLAGVATTAMLLSFGVTSASAVDATVTVKISVKPVVSATGEQWVDGTLSATASVAGTVDFLVDGTVLAGCAALPTSATAPFTAVCTPWKPAKGGVTVNITATLTPTDKALAKVTSATVAHPIGTPINASQFPISIYADTIVASGFNDKTADGADKTGLKSKVATGTQPYLNNAGCSITNYFVQGQTIVWRVWANDASDGGVVLTDKNAEVTLTVPGIKDPLKMAYGDHSGQAFWTVPLTTGAGKQYNSLGVIDFTVTVTRLAAPAVTREDKTTKYVAVKKNGKLVKVDGKPVYKPVKVKTTVIVKPAVLSSTVGYFKPLWVSPASQVTLVAVPA